MMKESNRSARSWWKRLPFLLPAILVAALVLIALPRTEPVLAAIPERLELPPAEDTLELETLSAKLGNYDDGVYTGQAGGYGGPVKVRVTVADGQITDISILSAAGETENYFRQAQRVIQRVYDEQTWDVDVISGATYSSRGILGAVQNAITGETVNNPAPPRSNPSKKAESLSFQAPAAYKDGTYTGSAEGFGGTIQVSVTIKDGKIAALHIDSAPGETEPYFSSAKAVVGRILSAGSPNVDTVSGATFSSSGIINATKRALNKAAVNPTPTPALTPMPTPAPDKPVMPAEPLRDGVYTGVGEGYGGDVVLELRVERGRITEVTVVSAEDETPAYYNRATALLPAILETQSAELDAVSGATLSSNGILAAAREAIAQAAAPEEPEPSETPEPTASPEPAESPEPSVTPEPTKEPLYADGTYTATGWCEDEDGTFRYEIIVTVAVEDGAIQSVRITIGEDESDAPEDNDYFIDRALNGTSRVRGVPAQIVSAQSADGIDGVSGATYSSRTIQSLARQALQQAKAAKDSGGAP